MDATRFDRLTRALITVPSRRDLLRGLASAALSLALAGLSHPMRAKDKHKKDKKPKPNAFGCLNVGQKCFGKDAKCCSGICQGKKPKKGKEDKRTCAAHDTGGCQAGAEPCAGANELCTTSQGLPGDCYTTTGNAGFCGASGAICTVCSRDSDCHELLGARAACVLCAGCAEGTLCASPG